MDDPSVFKSYVNHTLIVFTSIVINIIIHFVDAFTNLLSLSDEYINSFVKENHGENSVRTANAKFMITQNEILGLITVLFYIEYQ